MFTIVAKINIAKGNCCPDADDADVDDDDDDDDGFDTVALYLSLGDTRRPHLITSQNNTWQRTNDDRGNPNHDGDDIDNHDDNDGSEWEVGVGQRAH